MQLQNLTLNIVTYITLVEDNEKKPTIIKQNQKKHDHLLIIYLVKFQKSD